MKKLLGLLFTSTTVVSAAACGMNENETIVFGILFSENPEGTASNEFKAIAKHIGIGLDKEVEIVLLESNEEAIEKASTGKVDLVMGSTVSYWSANEIDSDLNIITTVAPDGDIDRAGYYSSFGTHIDNKADWENLTESEIVTRLEGKSFSFYSSSSTSGGLLPMQMFWDNTDATDYNDIFDIFTTDSYLGDVKLSRDHKETVRNILDRTTDFGVYYNHALDIATGVGNSYNYDDMFVFHEIKAPGDPLWGNISESEATKLNNYLEELNIDDNPDLYSTNAFHFNVPDVQFVRANQDLEVYQEIKNIDTDLKR